MRPFAFALMMSLTALVAASAQPLTPDSENGRYSFNPMAGAALATRLCTPEGFAMTAGVLVPLDIELIEDAIVDTPQLLRNRREELIDDRRFAEAIYRVALASGLMEQVAYQDTVSEAG